VGLAYAWITASGTYATLLHAFLEWAAPDCLGIAVITPTCIAIFQSDFRDRKLWRQNWIYLALTIALTIGSFYQDRIPLWVLIYPLLVVIALRVGLGWAALSLLLAVVTGSCYTIRGEGPFARTESIWPIRPGVLMQLYFAAGIFILYSISVVLERQKATERRLQEIASLHKLVTENCRDAIILINFSREGNYVSAAAESMTGWSREELLKMGNLGLLLHPEDQSNAVAIMSNLRSGVEGAVIEARLRKRSGEFLWVEASLRLIHDPVTGIPTGILKVVRDISKRKNTERRLQEIVALHKLVTENSRDVIILADFNGNRSHVSAVAESMGGWTREELLAQGSFGLVHPEDLPRTIAAVNELRSGAEGTMVECRVQKKSGEYVWVEANLHIVRDPATGAPSGILNIVRDVNERKQAEHLREFHYSLIRAIHDGAHYGILVVNEERNVLTYNKRFAELWRCGIVGTPVEPHTGTVPIPAGTLQELAAKCMKDPEAYRKRVENLYADPDAEGHCLIELKDGRTLKEHSTGLKSETGQYLGRVWFFSDITAQKQTQKRLEEAYSTVEALAVTDALTGLANRRRFDQYIASEWRRGMRDGKPLSMLLIDVDFFKSYNDAYGHLRGDSCLRQIAESCQDVVARPGDLVARFGGEEFAIILPNTDNTGALQVANEVCLVLRGRRLQHNGNLPGIVTVSIGCATLVPQFGKHVYDLIEMADQALYQAKNNGRNQVCSSNAVNLYEDMEPFFTIQESGGSKKASGSGAKS